MWTFDRPPFFAARRSGGGSFRHHGGDQALPFASVVAIPFEATDRSGRVFQLVHGGRLDAFNFRQNPEVHQRADALVRNLMSQMRRLGTALWFFEAASTSTNEYPVHPFRWDLPFMAAEAFAFALDGVQRTLRGLVSLPSPPVGVTAAADEFATKFAPAQHVRDSLHHWEERAQGQAWRKDMPTPAIDSADIRATEGTRLIAFMLIDDRLVVTLADGRPGELEVSERSVRDVQKILQSVLNSYLWTGPWKDVEPRWPGGILPENVSITCTTASSFDDEGDYL